mgnify:CR=1 FL=1
MILHQFSVIDAIAGNDTYYNTQNRIYDETKFSLLRKCDHEHQLFNTSPEPMEPIQFDNYLDKCNHTQKQFDLHVRAIQSASPKAVKRYKDARSR